jgi:transposase InsO family protein
VLLATKDEALAAFTFFQAQAEAEAGRKLGTLWIDHRGEFTTRRFIEHCIEQGVQRHFTTPYSQEQNGVVERRNKSVIGMVRSMLKGMNMPSKFRERLYTRLSSS